MYVCLEHGRTLVSAQVYDHCDWGFTRGHSPCERCLTTVLQDCLLITPFSSPPTVSFRSGFALCGLTLFLTTCIRSASRVLKYLVSDATVKLLTTIFTGIGFFFVNCLRFFVCLVRFSPRIKRQVHTLAFSCNRMRGAAQYFLVIACDERTH